MLKKLLVALMCVTVAFCAVSCKKDEAVSSGKTEGNGSGENTNYTETIDEDGNVVKDDAYYLSDLSTERYDGYNFRMLVRKGATETQYFAEPQEDIVDDAIYRRNQTVKDRYGIEISVYESSGTSDTDALNPILAGDDAYDVIFAHSFSAMSYAVQGACYNIREISTIHPEKPWWMADVANDCTVNGKLYILDGDISLTVGAAGCLMFNKNIFDELGFDYPYEMARDGEWTFDEFAYLAKKAAKDLNGNGIMEPEYDRYGFSAGEWGTPIDILYSGGQKVYTVTETGDIELTVYSNKTVEIYDEFFSFLASEACTRDTKNVNVDAFREGRLLFHHGHIGEAQNLRDMDDEFGIVPFPKFDEDDDYGTIINGANPLMVIPLTVSDPERTGAIIEALCAYAAKDVVPVYYEKALKTKYSRDDESEEMMDIIRESVIFDLGYISGSPVSTVGRTLFNNSDMDFASLWASQKDSAYASLEQFKEDYGGIKN